MIDKEKELEIVEMYEKSNYTLRHLAEIYNSNHHTIKRILKRYGVEVSRRKTLKPYTQSHKNKISESRKKLKESGWVPYNKGKKYSDMMNGDVLKYKNMKAHLRFDVSLEWLMRFEDFEKLKRLNRCITSRGGRYSDDTSWYMSYIEKFYNDEQFNKIYKRWISEKNNKYLMPTLDHITPRSKNGENDLNNLQFLSWFENRAKNDMSQKEWDELKGRITDYLV